MQRRFHPLCTGRRSNGKLQEVTLKKDPVVHLTSDNHSFATIPGFDLECSNILSKHVFLSVLVPLGCFTSPFQRITIPFVERLSLSRSASEIQSS